MRSAGQVTPADARVRPSQRWARLLGALGAVALVTGLATPVPARAQTAAEPTVVDEVGFVQPREIDGEIRVGVLSRGYDGSGEAWVPAEEAVLHVSESARETVPVDTEPYDPDFGPFYQFLGEPGDPVYTLQPESGGEFDVDADIAAAQAQGVVALGFAGHPGVLDGRHGVVDLQAVEGPGEAFVYDDVLLRDPDFGDLLSRSVDWDIDREDGRANAVQILPEAFLKSWSFTEAGVYCLDVNTRTSPLGEQDFTEHVPAALTVVVGDTEPASVTPCAQPDPDEEPDPVDPDAPFVFGVGTHADIAPEVGATGPMQLRLRKSDAAGGGNVSWHDFDDSVIHIPDAAARRSVPEGEQWAFLGEPGAQRWNIPYLSSDNPFAPWIGVGAAGTREADLARVIGIRVDGVAAADGGAAPGHMVVWGSNSNHGGSPTYSTRQGLPAAELLTGSHFHLNWDFSAPGVYCVGMDASGERTTGERLRDSQVLTFVVGDAVDPASVTPCGRVEGASHPSGTHDLTPETAPAGVPVALGAGSQDPGREFTFARLAAGLDSDGELAVKAVKGNPAGPGVAHDPDDAVVRVPEGTFPVFEGRPEWGEVGDLFWQSDYFAELNVDTLGLPPEVAPDGLRWSLTGVAGPGEFVVQGKSNDVLVGTREGFARDAYRVWPGYQEQNAWTFTEAGVYCVGMSWSATLASGEVVSDEHTLTFVAGEEPAEVLPCALGQEPTDPPDDDEDPTDPVDPPDPVEPPSGREVLDLGHIDLFARPGEGAVEMVVKDSRVDPSGPVYREVSDTVWHLPPWAQQTVPSSGYDFLGAPGSDVWVLPQTEDPELLWPGWDGVLEGGVTGYRLTLDEATGPGAVVLYTDGELGGGEPLLGSAAGLPSSFDFSAHGHANWAFTAPGAYCLDVTMSALPASAGLAPDSETLLVTVGGEVDPVSATPADCAASGPVDPPPGGGNPTDPADPPGAGAPDPSDSDRPGTPDGSVDPPGPGGSGPPTTPGRDTDPDDRDGQDAPGDGADPEAPGGGSDAPGATEEQGRAAVERIAGQTRIDTAVALSRSSFESADTVVVTTAADFPDALTAGPLAGTAEAPVLLTWPNELDEGVAAEIARLGASQVVVVGGEVAVEPSVAAALAQLAPLTRLGGTTRYGTAIAVAGHLGGVGATGGRVVLATGGDFPDALAGGVLAGRSGAPVLLTGSDGLPAETAAELGRRSPEEVLVLGGDVAVRDAVLPAVAEAAGVEPRRIAGDTRYATAAAVAAELGDAQVAYVSTGGGFADALAAVPVATMQDGVLLLVGANEVPAETAAALDALAPPRTVVLGGEAVVGPDVLAALDG